jgi:hypothetical protein
LHGILPVARVIAWERALAIPKRSNVGVMVCQDLCMIDTAVGHDLMKMIH